MHYRVAVRDVITVAIGIKEQVRRVHDPDSTVPGQGGVGEARLVGENLVRVVGAIAIGVHVHGDAAAAGRVVRRRLRLAVVLGAVIFVSADLPQSGRIRVLHIMRNPQPSTDIKAQMCWLGDQWLVQHRLDSQAVLQVETRKTLPRAEPIASNQRLCLEQHTTGLMKLVVGRPGRLGFKHLAGRRLVAGPVFPLAAEQAFEEIALNRWPVAPEPTSAVAVENLDRQLVPLSLDQAAGRHFVAFGQTIALLCIGGEAACAPKTFAIDECLMRGVARVDCQCDRFDPKIAPAKRRPVVRHHHPAAIPADTVGTGCPVRQRYSRRLPLPRPSAWPTGEES